MPEAMIDSRRVFTVTKPDFSDMGKFINEIPYNHDGAHIELFYNLIFSEQEITLPDHLRPVAWVLGDTNIDAAMLIISPGAGKSLLTDVAFPCFEIGYDPTTSIMGVSSGADLMVDFLQTSMNIIEENSIYKLLFPNVTPDMNTGWSTSRGIFVKRPATGQVSPSYQATGYGSKKITGKHAKILIIDDIHDEENSGTADQIEKVENFYYKTLIGRQDPKGSRMIMVGRRWAEDDLYGRLKKSGDWMTMTLASIRDTAELYYDVRIPAGLACVFNNFEAKETVEDIKVVYGQNTEQLGFYWNHQHSESCPPKCQGMVAKYKEALVNKKNKPAIYETVYQSNPEAVGSKIFRAEDFQDFYLPEGFELGRQSELVHSFMGKMQFDMILQSWDTGLTAETRNDPSCCYTMGIKSCGAFHRGEDKEEKNTLEEMPFHYDIYVLDEWYGRLEIGDLEKEAVNYFNLWNPNEVLVENSIAGIPLIQNLSQYSISVQGIKVQNVSKKNRAINGANAGSAQGWSRAGRIFIPRNAPWANELLKELDDFSGAKGKRDDRVDALVQAVNFSIDFGVLNRELPPGWRTEEEIQARMQSIMAPNHPFMQIPHMLDNQINPFYGYCGTCKMFNKETSMCKLHKRKVTKLDSCYAYDAAINAKMSIK